MAYVYHAINLNQLVRKFWGDGLSNRDIARRIGIGRSTVARLGKKMGLPINDSSRHGVWVKFHGRATPKPKQDMGPAPIGPIGDFPAGDTCRFIAGDVTPAFQCCGHPGFPFCDYHRAKTRVRGSK